MKLLCSAVVAALVTTAAAPAHAAVCAYVSSRLDRCEPTPYPVESTYCVEARHPSEPHVLVRVCVPVPSG